MDCARMYGYKECLRMCVCVCVCAHACVCVYVAGEGVNEWMLVAMSVPPV